TRPFPSSSSDGDRARRCGASISTAFLPQRIENLPDAGSLRLASQRQMQTESTPHHGASGLHHNVLILDPERKRLGLVRPFDQLRALRDRHRVFARAQPLRIAPGLAGADVEFPRMPWAADDLAAARVLVM